MAELDAEKKEKVCRSSAKLIMVKNRRRIVNCIDNDRASGCATKIEKGKLYILGKRREHIKTKKAKIYTNKVMPDCIY